MLGRVDLVGVAAARCALGAQLAAARRAAGLTQKAFAPKVNYHRSTIANVEIGHQNVPRTFRVDCDRILGTGTTFTDGYDQIEALVRAHRAELVVATGRARDVALRTVTDLSGRSDSPTVDDR